MAISPGGIYADCTFGRGGYARAILDSDDSVRVVGLDRDKEAELAAESFTKQYGDRFKFYNICFDELAEIFSDDEKFDGIVFDLGVSSPQLDKAERGFSFRFEGPLDMRMGDEGETAADVVNTYEETELANLIYKYGEERRSRSIAKAIVTARSENKFTTTTQLADLIRSVVPRSKDGIDPATRTFQALRIHVNDELGQLERALAGALSVLKPGGRLVVVSFHSLEDRIVKNFMNEFGKRKAVNRYLPEVEVEDENLLKIISRKPFVPSATEVAENARSRSAKLRVAEFIG